jgi:hypothetical protein
MNQQIRTGGLAVGVMLCGISCMINSLQMIAVQRSASGDFATFAKLNGDRGNEIDALDRRLRTVERQLFLPVPAERLAEKRNP